jgi:hypothetical protein
MKKYVVFGLVLFLPYLLSAQISSVFEEDMNAINVGVGYEKGKQVDGLSIDLGLSIKSRVELEGSYVKTNINTQDMYTYDGYINGYTGTLTWWLLSLPVNRSSTFSLGLKGGFDSFDYKNYRYWEDEDTFIEYDGYAVGRLGVEASISHWIDNQHIIMPSASVFYEMGQSTTVNLFVDSQNACEGMTGKIGAYLLRKTNFNDVFYLYPNLQFNYHERKVPVMLNLSVGLMVGY